MEDKVKWYLCNMCDEICPQLSPHHHSAECRCLGEGTKMELLEESDPKIQKNKYYKKLMENPRRWDRV
jgi:hypothetical protein